VYRWWVFLHIVGVFGFLISHGVSIGVTFQLRKERDPRRIVGLLELSGTSVRAFYASLVVLLGGGIVAGFLGHWWSQAWIWVSLGLLVLISVVMSVVASPYNRRVGLVARAMAGGSTAVSEEQLESILRSSRPITVAAIGFAGLLAILYLMMFKPSLGLSGGASQPPAGADLGVSANNIAFSAERLTAPADRAFELFFENEEAVPHNVSIYADESRSQTLFEGEIITGPDSVTYRIGPIAAGTYVFLCDVHPAQMTGTLEVG
jgi:plastocyanin